MHNLLSVCMNENTYFTKMALLNSLKARTDHDILLNKLCHVKLYTKVTSSVIVQKVPLQNRKFRQIGKFGLDVFFLC